MLNAAEVQSWFWKFTRVVIAVFLGVLCFGFAAVQIHYEASRYAVPWESGLASGSWAAEIKRAESLPEVAVARTFITLNIDDHEPFRASAAVSLPRSILAEIQSVIADTGDSVRWQSIAEMYVPSIEYGHVQLEMTRLSFELADGNANGTLRVFLGEIQLPSDWQRVEVRVRGARKLPDNNVTVRILTNGVQVITTGEAAVRQSDRETLLTARVGTSFVVLRKAHPDVPVKVRQRVRDVVSKFDFRYLYVIQPLVMAILYSIPFALLIVLLRRLEEDEAALDPARRFPAARYMKFALTFVVLFIGLGVTRAGLDLYFMPSHLLRSNLVNACGQMIVNSSGAAALGATFVFWYWPSFARAARRDRLGRSSRRARIILWIVLLVLTTTTLATVTVTCLGAGPLRNVAWGAAIAATIFAITAASIEVMGGWQALFSGISTTLVAMAIEVVDVIFDLPNGILLAVMAILAVPLFFSLLRMLLPRWNGWTLFAAALLLGGTLVVAPTARYDLWWQAELLTLATELLPALRLIVAVFLLALLRHLSREGKWAILERGERDAGIVMALTFFFLPLHQWLLIIVSFSLGWLVLQKWVFVPRNIKAGGDADAPATIRDVIRFHEAALALRMMKKDLRVKLAKAEMAFQDYERHVGGMEAFVDDLRARIEPRGNGAPAAVLSSGNAMEPWARAAMGAKYGLLFSIPWLALFLRDFHAGFAPERGFAWIAALGSALQAMGQWPLLGFFFGYFYAHLRGETGLSKGIYLFLAVVTPTFAATALAAPTSDAAWISLSFWALQLFIHCMLLGFFAGDYETLRAAGLGWRHLVDVHNLGALTAWGSGLLLAISAAATTVATTQAGALIMQALQTVVPELKK